MNRAISRRRLMGMVAVASVLAACAPAPPPTPVPAKPAEAPKPAAPVATPAAAKPAAPAAAQVKLKFQAREPEAAAGIQQLWKEFYADFRSKNPNIEVEWLPQPAQYFEQAVASFVAGTAADLHEHCCWISTYFLQEKKTLNLQPYIRRDATEVNMEDYLKFQFDPWKDKAGDVHLLPRFTGTVVLFYNKELFDQKGVPYLPKTWEETIDFKKYAEIGNKLKDTSGLTKWGSSNYGMSSNWLTQFHLRGYGINMVDPKDPNRAQLDDPKAQECLENIRKWIWDDKWFNYSTDTAGAGLMQFFLSGRLGMLEMGPWELVNVVEKAKFKWDVAPFPKGPAGHTTHQSVDGTFIWNGTKFKDESWTLLKGTTSPYYGRLYIKYATKQPSRKSLAPDFIKILREQNPVYKDINLEIFTDSIAKDIGRPEEMFNNDNVAKNEILKPAFDKVMLQGKAPVDLIGKTSKLVEKFNTGQLKIEQIGTELKALGI